MPFEPQDNCNGKIPTILDNRGDNNLLSALERLLACSTGLDVATGNFEIGSLLSLDKHWQALERMRILMGDEMTKRTKRELVQALTASADDNIELEKERDDNLSGLPAIRQALTDKRIATRVYTPAKFHAKAYIMQANASHPVDYAVVGSSTLAAIRSATNGSRTAKDALFPMTIFCTTSA